MATSKITNKIRIIVKSYDHTLLDKSVKKIIEIAASTGATTVGPVPLPVKKEIITVLRSVHVDKDAREQFEIRTHRRLIEIINPVPQTFDQLQRASLPSGVEIDIK